jgi:hypothetical protein
MKPDSIMIDEVKYVRADSIKETGGDIKIAVLDRGFVYVGRLAPQEDSMDAFLILTNAKNIRVWGTTEGLGELVSGPKKDTRLDNVGTIRVPLHALISLIDVEQAKWKGI